MFWCVYKSAFLGLFTQNSIFQIMFFMLLLISPIDQYHFKYCLPRYYFSSAKQLHERGRTTNGEIGPVTDQIYQIWNCTIFVI